MACLFCRQRLLPEPVACPRSSAGAQKTDIDSEGALRAFAVVHARGSKCTGRRMVFFGFGT